MDCHVLDTLREPWAHEPFDLIPMLLTDNNLGYIASTCTKVLRHRRPQSVTRVGVTLPLEACAAAGGHAWKVRAGYSIAGMHWLCILTHAECEHSSRSTTPLVDHILSVSNTSHMTFAYDVMGVAGAEDHCLRSGSYSHLRPAGRQPRYACVPRCANASRSKFMWRPVARYQRTLLPPSFCHGTAVTAANICLAALRGLQAVKTACADLIACSTTL